ncbi:MAG: hypothetical protein IKW67_03845 [Alphaproteobacteria bacterium]|nr:hypothetical protein [Alphaproteobacteria bacterium]
MDKDFEKISALLNGEQIDSYYKNQLTDADKAQIDNAIETLFSGLSLDNWLKGEKLMDAWKAALDTIREMIFSIRLQNPAVLYARQAVFEHRKKWHIKIVYSPHGHETINCSPEKHEQYQENANEKIQNGMEMLRKKFLEFESGTPKQQPEKKQIHKTTNLQMVMTRENEHERTREREI